MEVSSYLLAGLSETRPKYLATAITIALLQKNGRPLKCMQPHLPGRKGTAVSWVQPMSGNGD